jgi:hypothetical protein
MNTYTWTDKLNEGKAGADALATFLRSRGHEVEDVQDDPDYQQCDTDFIVDGHQVEVKSGPSRTNLFLETEGLHKSTATYWFFYLPNKHIALCFPREALVNWLDTHKGTWHTVRTEHNGRSWEAHGMSVSMRRLYRDLPCRIYHIKEKAA